MKLINCPICGTRCSADSVVCPECGFEIKNYFEDHKQPQKKAKSVSIIALLALFIIAIIIAIIFTIMPRSSTNESNSSSESLDDIFSDTTDSNVDNVSASPSESSVSVDVSGVYSGDDHEILVLNNDGLAYYYCTSIEFTELQCPWYIEDGKVFIDLSRLHCTVVADVDDKELLFKSDSANWNTELFSKLDVEPEQYLTKALKTNDSNATLNYDGTITYNLDGITYTLPKSFIDYKDDFDDMEDCSAFIDQDLQSDYMSSVLFQSAAGAPLDESAAKELSEVFASGFYDNVAVTFCTPTVIAGYQAYLCEITGYLNEGFNKLQNHEISGYISIFYNTDTKNDTFIMMVQYSNRSTDNSSVFGEILKSANPNH